MNLVLLGPQGSGKGTQAQLLAERFHLRHLEMGKILREMARSMHPRATEIDELVKNGKLVPDELVAEVVESFVMEHDPRFHGLVFEGYPRTVGQYEHVKEILAKYGKKITAVFNIEISEEETVKRLSARRTCQNCGRVYNLLTNPAKIEGVCDSCGGKLIQRVDDTPEIIRKRLRLYREQTHPVFGRAVEDGVGYQIEGERPIEAVFGQLVDIIAAI